MDREDLEKSKKTVSFMLVGIVFLSGLIILAHQGYLF